MRVLTCPEMPRRATSADDKTGCSAIVSRTAPLEYVRAIRSVFMCALTAPEQVDNLVVIVPSQVRPSDYRLSVPVHITDFRRALAVHIACLQRARRFIRRRLQGVDHLLATRMERWSGSRRMFEAKAIRIPYPISRIYLHREHIQPDRRERSLAAPFAKRSLRVRTAVSCLGSLHPLRSLH